ncbi:MAG TPA: VOC family protein [Steroidobacteraceae bacterium]|nr:VOC family protein [Steroidobacteraceae bacterium]HRX90481.1 VOC family protein [Steroidobacteraceae bacterium]
MSGTGPVKRITLWVRDAEASLAIYRDVLGLQVLEDKTIAGPAIGQMIGLEETQLRIVHLAPAGATHGWIGLYQLTNPKPQIAALPAPPADRPAYGQATIVLTTDKGPEILAKLRARNVRFMTTPREYTKETPSDVTPAGHYTEVIFFDPDNIPVSLIGYQPL